MYGGAPVRSDGGSGLPITAKVLRLTCFVGETKASYRSKIMKNSSEKWSKESVARAEVGEGDSRAGKGRAARAGHRAAALFGGVDGALPQRGLAGWPWWREVPRGMERQRRRGGEQRGVRR